MTNKIDDVSTVSVMVMRGNPGWLTGIAGPDGNVATHELDGLPPANSLMEAEILVTTWLAGRGFTLSSPWRTTDYSGSGEKAVQTEAEFVRK